MTIPLRIQRKRVAGWTMPANTISVTRPGLWSNPFTVEEARQYFEDSGTAGDPQATAVEWYRIWVTGQTSQGRRFPPTLTMIRAMLAGKNLSCWCKLCPKHSSGKPLNETCTDCAPCHVDPLGIIANNFKCEAA